MKNKNSTCSCKKQNLGCPIACALKNNPKIIYLILGLICVAVVAILIINRVAEPPAEPLAESPAEIPIVVVEPIGETPIIPIEPPEKIPIIPIEPPKEMIKPLIVILAIIRTNKGDIKIELFNDMPITVNNFVSLAEKGFYDEVIFHRVISGFMIQGGCPDGIGTGGPGHTIDCEFLGYNRNTRGTISMANAGPNTGGSQFFINLVDNNFLNNRHAVFGRVIEGMNVVDAIGQVETGPGDRPVKNVVIENIEIIRT